jgi:hypothetical protein
MAHAVHILSQFVCTPTSIHYGHLLRVLQYLRLTSSQSLFYARDSPLQLHAYSDSTWASDPTDRRSITGYCILLHLLGSSRSKQLYLILIQRQNFEHLLLLLQRLYGSDGYWLILVFLVISPHLFYVIV